MCSRWWRALLAVSFAFASVLAAPTPVAAQEVPAVTTHVVDSFDGTPLLANLFVPSGVDGSRPAPLVLLTHGWGGTGQKAPTGFVADLLDAGYVVVTWDQRGFGCSGGEVQIDKPEWEGRDVQALIDWAVANAPVQLDATGDPLVGMTGGSYAGGVQTAAASVDDRIDVLAPEISWADLRYSLYGGQVVNQGWATLLYLAGLASASGQGLDPSCPTHPQPGGLDPMITRGFTEGSTTAAISDEVLDFFAGSSLASYGQDQPVDIPTLVVQGSTDTLFDLTDGWRIVEHVRATGAPTRFLVFCGGHVACPDTYADAGDGEHVDAAVLAWFARHLRGDDTVDVGPPVEYRTNEGVWRATTGFPAPGSPPLEATGAGSLVSVPNVDAPDLSTLGGASFDGGIPALPFTSAAVSAPGDIRAMTVEVARATDRAVDLLGIPTVTLQVEGVGDEVILMAKLVDRESGAVVNLQEGAVRVPLLDGGAQVEVPMPGVAYTLPAGHHLDLQVSTASLMHSNARTPATVDVIATVSVPVQAVDRAAAPAGPTSPAPAPTPAAPPVTLPATGAETSGTVGAALAAAVAGVGLLLAGAAVRRRRGLSC
ncbi:MAG TPA: alpha/beta fold hydrolase [Acidimicrobiales bacterium]|nr:alpha/beta fold hydrolase [Acidimicrobiales bacterium]